MARLCPEGERGQWRLLIWKYCGEIIPGLGTAQIHPAEGTEEAEIQPGLYLSYQGSPEEGESFQREVHSPGSCHGAG